MSKFIFEISTFYILIPTVDPISTASLDIILPLYNPRGDWDTDIIRQYKELEERVSDELTTQLIIVNDGSSTDIKKGIQTIKGAVSNFQHVSYLQNRGKGYALRQGVDASQANYLIYTDHDFPYTYGSMIEILNSMIDDCKPVVIGHRDEKYYEELPWFRVKVSHYLKTINRFILGLNTDDTQCGLKGFQKSIKPIFLETKTQGFLIDIEFLKRLKKANVEVQVLDVKSRDNVEMSTLGFRTIFSELFSYFKILWNI